MPPIGGAAATVPGAMESFAAGGAPGQPGAGVDQQRAQAQAYMGKLRDLDTQVQEVLGEFTQLQPLAQQMSAIIKKAAQMVAKTVSGQTGSAEALPGAGQ